MKDNQIDQRPRFSNGKAGEFVEDRAILRVECQEHWTEPLIPGSTFDERAPMRATDRVRDLDLLVSSIRAIDRDIVAEASRDCEKRRKQTSRRDALRNPMHDSKSSAEWYSSAVSQGRIELLQKMLEEDPADAFCRYGMAQEYLKAGDISTAIAWFDKTIEVDVDYCYAYYHKARALQLAQRLDEACQCLRVGLERAGSAGDSHAMNEIRAFLDELT
ncbi:MAG: tetratricopeptide repeat protein [Phycisphaerales bacterium]|nr:tetratricopeptide repeat protein [Phycisphaerales bacterium]